MIETLSKIAKTIKDAIVTYFKSGKAEKDAEVATKYIQEALPIIAMLTDVVTGLTPTPVDDVAWGVIKTKYPRFFDGSLKNSDELKLYALGIGAQLLKAKFPALSTTQATLAVQAAYLGVKAEKDQTGI